MYSHIKEWKEFNISLDSLKNKMKEDFPETFVGICADINLRIHFSEEPSQEELEAIDAHYESLDGSDYISVADLKAQEEELEAAILAVKTTLAEKSWDQMSVTERKIAMNLKVSRADMGLE